MEQRIDNLRRFAAGDKAPFNEASLNHMQAFVREIDPSIRPGIFLLANGNIRIMWRGPQREQMGIQFFPDGLIQCVFFDTSDKYRTGEFYSIEEVKELAASMNVTHLWQ